jgi:hypothetical protein
MTLLLHGRNNKEAFDLLSAHFDSIYDYHTEHRDNPVELTRFILKRYQKVLRSYPDTRSRIRKISRVVNTVYDAAKDQIGCGGDCAYSVQVSSRAGPVRITFKPIEHEHALSIYQVHHPVHGVWCGCVSSFTKKPMTPHHIDDFFFFFKEAARMSSRHSARQAKIASEVVNG